MYISCTPSYHPPTVFERHADPYMGEMNKRFSKMCRPHNIMYLAPVEEKVHFNLRGVKWYLRKVLFPPGEFVRAKLIFPTLVEIEK